jgi:hypothetical protein
VWVDKRVLLKHTGTYVFDFAAQDQLYKDLHALAQTNGQATPVDTTPAEPPAPVAATVLAASKKSSKTKKK